MSQDNVNGHADPMVAAALAGAQAVPVHAGVVQALSETLDRARRCEIHGIMLVGVRGTDLASFDTVVVDNMALAMIMLGSMQVVAAKVVQGARDAQQQVSSSRIVRPPAGLKV